MSNIWNDLFESYRRYKWMDVDSPQYEPLENGVVSKDDLKRLKAREYAEKNKDRLKVNRLQKIVDNLRAENKTLKENQKAILIDDREELLRRIDELEESNEKLLRERDSKNDGWVNENRALRMELERMTQNLNDFKEAVKIIMRFI